MTERTESPERAEGETEVPTERPMEPGETTDSPTWGEGDAGRPGKRSLPVRLRSYLAAHPRARGWLALGGLVLLAAIGWFWHYRAIRESTDDAFIDGSVSSIASRVTGTVLKVHVVENQRVEPGQVLVEIDPTDYRLAVARAEAELADAKSRLTAAQHGVPITSVTTESQVESSKAAVERARAGLEMAQQEVDMTRARLEGARARLAEAEAKAKNAASDRERLKKLVAKEEVSRQEYDAAVAAADSAGAARDSARAAVSEAETVIQVVESNRDQAAQQVTAARADLQAAETAPHRVEATKAEASAARARVEMASTRLEQAKVELSRTTIRAPIGGVVGKKGVSVGDTVQAGQPLLAIVALDDVWVTANFKETQLAHMRPGQKARIHVDTYGKSYDGHVESIGPASSNRFSLLPAENASGNYVKVVQRIPVRLRFEKGQDPDRLLRPGMSVVPTVITK